MADATTVPAAATTAQVDDIGADIAAAWDQHTTAPDTTAAPASDTKPADTTTAPASDKPPRDDGRDERGRFAKQGETQTPAAPATETPAAPGVTAPEAPAHWPAKDRELFAKATPEHQAWLLERHKAMEADYTRKTQEIAPARRLKEQLDEILGPHRQKYSMSGLDDAAAIRQLVSAHEFLERDPANAIRYLAQQYGFDINTLNQQQPGSDTPSPVPPEVNNRLAQLERADKERIAAAEKQQQEANLAKVTAFAEEKDAQGQLLRPHFDEVASVIQALMQADITAGKQPDLQSAYDRAVYADPAVRQKVLAAQDAKRKADEEAERKRKADEAKRAGFDVTGTGGLGTPQITSNSIRGEIEAAWAAHEGRV